MNKFQRAMFAFTEQPVAALSVSILGLLRDGERRWVRLTHPGFTLEIRLDATGKPLMLGNYQQPDEDRAGAVEALDGAVRVASEGRSGLVDLMNACQSEDWLGIYALRALLRTGLVEGGRHPFSLRSPRPPTNLRLVEKNATREDTDTLVAP